MKENGSSARTTKFSKSPLKREAETLRLLAGASNLLEKCTDYEATIEMIANLLVSSLASWCAIDLVTEDSKIVRAMVVHHDPLKADLAKQILLHLGANDLADVETPQKMVGSHPNGDALLKLVLPDVAVTLQEMRIAPLAPPNRIG